MSVEKDGEDLLNSRGKHTRRNLLKLATLSGIGAISLPSCGFLIPGAGKDRVDVKLLNQTLRTHLKVEELVKTNGFSLLDSWLRYAAPFDPIRREGIARSVNQDSWTNYEMYIYPHSGHPQSIPDLRASILTLPQVLDEKIQFFVDDTGQFTGSPFVDVYRGLMPNERDWANKPEIIAEVIKRNLRMPLERWNYPLVSRFDLTGTNVSAELKDPVQKGKWYVVNINKFNVVSFRHGPRTTTDIFEAIDDIKEQNKKP